MPKVGMEPIRKNQVINATLECISESSFESTPKNPKLPSDVIPAKAGIQSKHTLLDPCFRRGDDFWTFRSGLSVEGLTFESVAKKAGVSKGVVSYYFKGKEDLILQSFRAFLDHYNQKVALEHAYVLCRNGKFEP